MSEVGTTEAIPLALPAKAEITPGMRAVAIVAVVGVEIGRAHV